MEARGSRTRFWINIFNIYQSVFSTKQWDDVRLVGKVLSYLQMECGLTSLAVILP
jgi:hypothetical protein